MTNARGDRGDRGSERLDLRTRVARRDAGTRVLDYLLARFRYHDEATWRAQLAAGRVRVDGAVADADSVLRGGDELAYAKDHVEPDVPTDFTVLHEGRGFVVVDKPAGLPFHADGAFVRRTLVGLLGERLEAKLRPVQRLDRETSGVCAIATSRATVRPLADAIAAGSKVYEAIVHGVIERDVLHLDGPIARDPSSEIAIRRAVVAAGAPASTTVTVLARTAQRSHVRCEIATGRTHQIRVHLAHAGHPIVGDKLYGRTDAEYLAWVRHVKAGGDPAWGERLGAARQLLHAAALTFIPPGANEPRAFTAPLPPDFESAWTASGPTD